jgi:hypothetical protein
MLSSFPSSQDLRAASSLLTLNCLVRVGSMRVGVMGEGTRPERPLLTQMDLHFHKGGCDPFNPMLMIRTENHPTSWESSMIITTLIAFFFTISHFMII